MFDQALDGCESTVAGGKHQRTVPLGQHKVTRRPQHREGSAGLDVARKQMLSQRIGLITRNEKKQITVVTRTTGHRVGRVRIVLSRHRPAQQNRLSGQKTQPMGARSLQMQQSGIGRQHADRTHLGHDLLFRYVLRAAGLQQFQRELAAGGSVAAHQGVALRFFRFRQGIVKVLGFHDLAGNHAHLAHTATAIAAAVVEFEPGVQTGLQQVGVPFHQELVPAGAHGDLCRHDFEHIVHYFQ